MAGQHPDRGDLIKQTILSGAVVLVVLATVLGAMLLTEAFQRAGQTPVAQATPSTPTGTWTPTTLPTTPAPVQVASLTPAPAIPSPTSTLSPTPAPTDTATPAVPILAETAPVPTMPPCQPPANWMRYRVRAGDTLSTLAFRCGLSLEALMQANCLSSEIIYVGQVLYLPFIPAAPVWPTQPVYPTVPAYPTVAWTPYPTPTPAPIYPTPTP
ncbi:MAG: LysM peptidoglycan-binding domain-containing protein, partial [Anaerolineae bacterium]